MEDTEDNTCTESTMERPLACLAARFGTRAGLLVDYPRRTGALTDELPDAMRGSTSASRLRPGGLGAAQGARACDYRSRRPCSETLSMG